jgi:uncharacterized damage-inducible protein DinB
MCAFVVASGVSRQPRIANSIIDYALTGGTAHVATRTVFDGLDWRTAGARVDGSSQTLFQLLNHMIFWQEGALEWLDGGSPSMPEHAADSWPGPEAPSSRTVWVKAVRRFRAGLTRLERAAKDAGAARKGRSTSPLEMLAAVAAHNSYHAGQAVLLRQLLGQWPPPSGGLTW